MSSPHEKIEAIRHAVKIAKDRLARLEALEAVGAMTKAQSYEKAMTIECINKGEKLLREFKN